MVCGLQEVLVLVLAAQIYRGAQLLGELAHGGHGAVDAHAAAPVGGNLAACDMPVACVVGVGLGGQEEAALDHGALRAFAHGRGVGAVAHEQLDRRQQRGFAGARFARDHREARRGRERRFANKGDILHVELVEHGETFLECAAARRDGQVSSIIGSWDGRLRAVRKPKGNGESA